MIGDPVIWVLAQVQPAGSAGTPQSEIASRHFT
jgi:hypothetical protein